MTTISLRLDDDLKHDLEQMCSEMGMSLTTFFTIYAKRALRDRKIPFEITAPVPSGNPIDPDKLDWNRIGELLDDAERINKDAPGVPWEEVAADMRRRVHGRAETI